MLVRVTWFPQLSIRATQFSVLHGLSVLPKAQIAHMIINLSSFVVASLCSVESGLEGVEFIAEIGGRVKCYGVDTD